MRTPSIFASVRYCLFAIAVSTASAASADPEFIPLGALPDPNTFGSTPNAVSADGKTITGESHVSGQFGGQSQAVRWNHGVGPTSLGFVRGLQSVGTAVSARGEVIIGSGRETSGPGMYAFYWTEGGGAVVPSVWSGYNSAASAVSRDGSTMAGAVYGMGPPWSASTEWQAVWWSRFSGSLNSMGYLPGGSNTYSSANAISADGSVIVGTSTSATAEYEAFRWTQMTGMVGLGFLPGGTESHANFVSDDGQVIGGQVGFAFDPTWRAAFRWTEATGMIDLGTLPGAMTTMPRAMSRDGRFIVGQSGTEAFSWSEAGGMVGLGQLPDEQQSMATAVSADGNVILGFSFYNDGRREDFVWTDGTGRRVLREIFAASGIDVSGWRDLQARAMSEDGNTIVGQGTNPSGYPEGWMFRFQGNRAPIAQIGWSPQWPYKRTSVSFWGTASTDPEGDEIIGYRWDFGDGATAEGPVVSHTYAEAGNYTVTLIVNDGKLDSAPGTLELPVFNRAPVANAGGPYAGYKNTAIAFNGTASSDGDGDPLTYAWDFGDGTTGTGPSPAHAYANSGTYTVTLVVNDGSGDSLPARATVTIQTLAPTANAGPNQSVIQRTSVSLNGTASTDADGQIVGAAWRQVAGPAVTLAGSTTLSARFVAPRVSATTTLTFELTVTDDDGLSSADQMDVVVRRR